MRKIFDFIKEAIITLDDLWINNAGHEIKITEIPPIEGCNITIYGFYDIPKIGNNNFGIDAPDKIEVQISMDTYLKHKDIIKLGSKLKIEGAQWKIVHTTWIFNRFLGKYRLELVCSMFLEHKSPSENGVHMHAFGNKIIDEE